MMNGTVYDGATSISSVAAWRLTVSPDSTSGRVDRSRLGRARTSRMHTGATDRQLAGLLD